jgi:hypothetical protein
MAVAWLVHRRRKEQKDKYILLTYLIVCDLDREQFPVLQARIESIGVSTRCRQIHAGVFERTLRDGVSV